MDTYSVYGLRLRSQWPLPCPARSAAVPPDLEILEAADRFFAERAGPAGVRPAASRFQCSRLPDGSYYLSWRDRFEFLVFPDGRRIAARSLTRGAREPIDAQLLGQLLSFAMPGLGVDPIHATTVVVDGAAVGILGDSGYGKSTLAASFLAAGYRVLTDDLLVLRRDDERLLGQPGPPLIKLFPPVAEAVLGAGVQGTCIHERTDKLLIPLDGAHHAEAAPLAALLVLDPPVDGEPEGVSVRSVGKVKAFEEIVRSTYNDLITERTRLARHFSQAARVAATVPACAVGFGRELALLPEVRRAVLAWLAASGWEKGGLRGRRD